MMDGLVKRHPSYKNRFDVQAATHHFIPVKGGEREKKLIECIDPIGGEDKIIESRAAARM